MKLRNKIAGQRSNLSRGGSKGMTLVEIKIAMTVFSLAMIGPIYTHLRSDQSQRAGSELSNAVSATNYVIVRLVYLNDSTNPPAPVQQVQVNTDWSPKAFGRRRLYTNTLVTYAAPDDR